MPSHSPLEPEEPRLAQDKPAQDGAESQPRPPASEADPHQRPDGNNATIHQPDDEAEKHRVRPGEKVRGPYVTGNY